MQNIIKIKGGIRISYSEILEVQLLKYQHHHKHHLEIFLALLFPIKKN